MKRFSIESILNRIDAMFTLELHVKLKRQQRSTEKQSNNCIVLNNNSSIHRETFIYQRCYSNKIGPTLSMIVAQFALQSWKET